jgi:hypothetical protein
MGLVSLGSKIEGLECRFAQDEVEQGGVVGLDDEKENLLKWDIEELWANDDMAWIAPYASADQVRVPRNGVGDGDLSSE